MKKILVPFLLVAMLCTCFVGCGRAKNWVLQDIPNELTIDPKTLSEDVENKMDLSQSYPLIAALPEEDVYIYYIDPILKNGALVKYDGVIQYFSWLFSPVNANFDLYLSDYNGDGEKDLALTFVTSSGQTNYNEELHVLMHGENRFQDYFYLKSKAVQDAKSRVTMEQKTEDTYVLYSGGTQQTVRLSGYGELYGLYFDDVQDYTLGDTITLRLDPGLVFTNTQLPVRSVFTYEADISFDMGTCTQKSVRVEVQ